MTFKKLLIKHKDSISEISALAASINAGHEDVAKIARSVFGYHNLYTKLLKMKPKKSPFYIRVAEYEDHYDKQKYISVDGYKTDPQKQAYALEFRPWREWLSMNMVDCIKNEKMSIAYCLWEMTFMGFDQITIQKQMQEIKRRVKEVKSGKAKLIPAKEVFKRIRDKYANKKKK